MLSRGRYPLAKHVSSACALCTEQTEAALSTVTLMLLVHAGQSTVRG